MKIRGDVTKGVTEIFSYTTTAYVLCALNVT